MTYNITLAELLLKKELIIGRLKENQKNIIYGNFYTDAEVRLDVRALIAEQEKLREDLMSIKSVVSIHNMSNNMEITIYELTELKQQLYATMKMLALHSRLKSSQRHTISERELQVEKAKLEFKIKTRESALTKFNTTTTVHIELNNEVSLTEPIEKLA